MWSSDHNQHRYANRFYMEQEPGHRSNLNIFNNQRVIGLFSAEETARGGRKVSCDKTGIRGNINIYATFIGLFPIIFRKYCLIGRITASVTAPAGECLLPGTNRFFSEKCFILHNNVENIELNILQLFADTATVVQLCGRSESRFSCHLRERVNASTPPTRSGRPPAPGDPVILGSFPKEREQVVPLRHRAARFPPARRLRPRSHREGG